MTGTPWQEAREGARRVRRALFPDTADTLIPADTLLQAALRDAGLRCSFLPPHDTLLSGAHALLDTEATTIWLRTDALPEDRRLYIAHELAHFHQHENGTLCDESDLGTADDPHLTAVGYGPRQRRETEANVWAREFFLPLPVAASSFASGLTASALAARVGVALATVHAQLASSLGIAPPAPFGGALPAGGNVPLHPVISFFGSAEKGDTRSSGTLVPAHSAPPEGAGGANALDATQQAAAHAANGPLLVGAGPGTGKTRTLTARVLYLTRERGVAAENLLALTFSRKAAEEMRERIGAVAPEVAQKAGITTFHAYGLDLLRRHGKAAGLPPIPVLLDRAEACALLERRVADLGLTVLRYLHDPAFPLPDVLRLIGQAKEDLVGPAEFTRRAEAANDDKLRDVARVYVAYEALLREKGALDFSDLVCRALWLLESDPDVCASERAQWRHLLVDEYQDVNRAGALLVRALAGPEGAGLWAVGDLRQAIYRFRGASPANVSRFHEDFPTGKRAELGVNYRSRPGLVELFGEASGEGADAWLPARPEGDTTRVLAVAENDIAQAEGIATRMRTLVADGCRWGDMAVLCRTRGQARALRLQLAERKIPLASGPDEDNLLASHDVKRLLALLSRACEPSGPARRLWPELPRGLNIEAYSDAYAFWAEALWGEPGLARTLKDGEAVAQLLALAQAFRDRAPILLGPEEDPHRAFLRHLRRLVRLRQPLSARLEPLEAPNAVQIMTIHASKGLEFPVVFVPNLSAGKFPARSAPSLLPSLPDAPDSVDSDNAAAEEARLFFVALTRARDHLILSRAEKYGRISAKPSPLLASLDGATEITQERWGMAQGTPVARVVAGMASGEAKPAEAIPSQDADLYLRCPRRYYYARVEDLKESESTAYAAFKRAVGETLTAARPVAALEKVWAEKGPEAEHPHTPLYRAAAEEIVGRMDSGGAVHRTIGRRTGDGEKPPVLAVALEEGVVTVQPDAVEANGAVLECQTFRRPPAESEETAPSGDRWLSLLQEAAKTAGPEGKPAQVVMHYLQDGRTLPVADRPRQRAGHLEKYNGALRGIKLRVFPAAPEETTDCPTCPYFFICPE